MHTEDHQVVFIEAQIFFLDEIHLQLDYDNSDDENNSCRKLYNNETLSEPGTRGRAGAGFQNIDWFEFRNHYGRVKSCQKPYNGFNGKQYTDRLEIVQAHDLCS